MQDYVAVNWILGNLSYIKTRENKYIDLGQ